MVSDIIEARMAEYTDLSSSERAEKYADEMAKATIKLSKDFALKISAMSLTRKLENAGLPEPFASMLSAGMMAFPGKFSPADSEPNEPSDEEN